MSGGESQVFPHKSIWYDNTAHNRLSCLNNCKSPVLNEWLRGSTYMGLKYVDASLCCILV